MGSYRKEMWYIMGSKKKRSLERIDPNRRALKNFSDHHDELIKGMIEEGCCPGSNNRYYRELHVDTTDDDVIGDSIGNIKLPLPWQQIIYNNKMYMFLNSNGFYSINIPTNFYVCNTGSNVDVVDEEPPILDWKIEMPPLHLLDEFVKWSAYIYQKYHSEAAALLVWNTSSNSWRITYPYQTISGASVTFDMNNQSGLLTEDDMIIIDLHSHHTMNIGFSSTDDHSDGTLGAISHISVVLKSIDKMNMLNYNNNFDIRLTVQSTSYVLKIEDVFRDINTWGEIADSVVQPLLGSQTHQKHVTIDKYPHIYRGASDNGEQLWITD